MTLDEFVPDARPRVTQAYIQGMKQAGSCGGASVEDLVRAKDHGVTPEFVQRSRGWDWPSPVSIRYIRLRDHGVKGDFAQGAESGRLRQAERGRTGPRPRSRA